MRRMGEKGGEVLLDMMWVGKRRGTMVIFLEAGLRMMIMRHGELGASTWMALSVDVFGYVGLGI